MKKTLLIATIAALGAVTSFGQGYINFQGFLHNVGNDWTTPGTPVYQTGIDVELFYAASTATPLVEAIMSGTTSANVNALGYNNWVRSVAWGDITADTTFVPVPGTNGTPVSVFQSAANGGGAYNNSGTQLVNALTGGTTYHFYEVAWYVGASGQYTTLAQAAAGNTYVGWSQAFNYTANASSVPAPTSFSAGNAGNILVGGVGVVPEPATLALVGLGGLSLLLFRRRN